MHTTLTEKNSFVRRIFVLLVAAALLVPALALAETHPLFNLQSTTQSPFPSDRFTAFDSQQLTGLRVNVPLPNCATNPSDCADLTLLNQLDGFNLQPRLSIPFDGAINVSTVNSSTVFLLQLPGRGLVEATGDISNPHVIGINQIVWDPASLTLFAESNDHLDEDSNYVLIVTTGVHDASGNPIAAGSAFAQFIHGDGGVDGKNADRLLKLYQGALKHSLDNDVLKNIGISSGAVAAASIFTTESATATLRSIREQIKSAAAPAVNFNLGTGGEKTVFPSVPPQGTEDIFFNLFIPSGPRPTNGWPVAIFGHGFTDSKQGAPFAVASILAHNGIASIAINVVGHGFGPNSTLTVQQGAASTTFLEGGRGVDQDGNGQITSAEGSSTFVLSPQGTIGSRDALQQTVANLMELVRAIQGGIDADGDGLPDLDANRIYYAGQSFGGIYGTIFLGIEPDIRAGVPNVPGGPIIDIVRLSPSFQLLLTQALAVRTPSLLNAGPPIFFNDNSPLRNLPPVTNNVPGAIAIQTVEDTSRWLGQAGDPVAWAPFIRKNPLPGDLAKSVIIQFARGDMTVPNPTATALIRSGDLTDRATFYRNDIAFPLGLGLHNPHTFLTSLPKAIAIEPQIQIGVFFASDGALTIDPDSVGLLPPSVPPLFETPIAGPLPEDLGFLP
jgi:hypothetical protein